MVFVFQKVFTNTIFYQILVFGDTNISIKIIFGLFLGIFWTKLPNIQIRLPTTASLIFGWHNSKKVPILARGVTEINAIRARRSINNHPHHAGDRDDEIIME